jgi:hypothetical protein
MISTVLAEASSGEPLGLEWAIIGILLIAVGVIGTGKRRDD